MSIHLRSQAGQASAEFVAVLPLVLLIGVVVWQLALAGESAWLAANAARVAARAEAVGRDGRSAARSAVPAGLRDSLRVSRDSGARLKVQVPVPLLLGGRHAPVNVGATAKLGAEP